jgi:hypothetical protein
MDDKVCYWHDLCPGFLEPPLQLQSVSPTECLVMDGTLVPFLEIILPWKQSVPMMEGFSLKSQRLLDALEAFFK